MMGDNDLSDLFEVTKKSDLFEEQRPEFGGPASPDDLFSIFESLDAELTRLDDPQKQPFSSVFHESETELEFEPVLASSSKRPKLNSGSAPTDGQQRVSHITVERNRRKQMNEHLTVLRKLMPCFYVKRGDQASIIGGVIDYINELQQILQSLESKKQRKAYTESVLSPRPVLSPSPVMSPRLGITPTPAMSPRPIMNPSARPSPLSPRAKPPLSPRLNSFPISPRTPQPTSPYKPRLQQPPSPTPTSSSSGPATNDSVANELAANSKSDLADVEVKLSGANLLLKTVSTRIPGQVMKIISTLEELSLEILQVNISSVDDTVVNSFTIKIGIECHLSADELAHRIQQTFQP